MFTRGSRGSRRKSLLFIVASGPRPNLNALSRRDKSHVANRPFIISLFVDKCQIKDLLCYCSVIMSASSIMKGWEQGQHYWLCLRPYYVWLAYRIWGLDKGPLGWDRLTAGSPGQRLRFEICWQIQRRTTTEGDSLCSCGHKGSLTGTLEQSFETPPRAPNLRSLSL